MFKIPKKLLLSQEAYVDQFVIRGVKFTRTAHLGEIFEVEYAPYEYIQALKRIKTIKKLLVHKVDQTNLNLLRELLRKYQKQIHHFINYGPWLKQELDSLKKLVRNKKIAQVNVGEKRELRHLPIEKDLQEITFNIPRASKKAENLENKRRDSRLRALRLNKLRRIVIEGHCDSPNFEAFMLGLERDLKYLKSLEEIRLSSVVMKPRSQILLQSLKLWKLIKEIRIGFNDFSSSVVEFINHAESLPAVQKLTGLMALQELEAVSKLEEFKDLRSLDLLFFRENISYDLSTILNEVKLSKSIESISLNLVHVEADAEESKELKPDIFGNLPNLNSIKLVATINPTIDNIQVANLLETVSKANKLKNLHLELNNSMFFVQSADLVPFDFSLMPLTQGFSNINSLVLKLPLITFESFPENLTGSLQISYLMLEGAFGIKYSENISRLLKMISPSYLTRLELHELEFNDPEAISEHVEALGTMKNLQNAELIYKNGQVSSALYQAFRDLTKVLANLTFLSIKIDRQEAEFQEFRKKLLDFVCTLPKMNFVQIESYSTNSSQIEN